MSAAAVLRAAALTQLRSAIGTQANRVFDGPGAVATPPHVELREATASDWGTKDRVGREVRIGVAVRDAGDTPARCQALADAVEGALEALPRDLPGWRIASVVPVRAVLLPEGAGRWAALIDVRFRMLAA